MISASDINRGNGKLQRKPPVKKTGKRYRSVLYVRLFLGQRRYRLWNISGLSGPVEKEPQWDETGLKKRTCQSCGKAETLILPPLSESHTHEFSGAETIVKEATCTEEGKKTVACATPGCSAVKEEVIPAIGHKPGEWEVTEKATCEKDGKKVQKCTACQIVLKTETIKAAGQS